jgi:hypothetical protein
VVTIYSNKYIMTPKKLSKIFFRTILVIALFGTTAVTSLLFWSYPSQAEDTMFWGVNFSDSQATYLGLDPRETYNAIIHDLGVSNIKIHVNWNAVQTSPHEFDFSALDYQIKEAEEHGVSLILVIGKKTGRWPECHTPDWFLEVPADEREAVIIQYISTIVGRYKHSEAVQFWQVENEPFLEFGTCPDWYYEAGTSLVEAEVAAVRSLDPTRKIIVSESGELSTWTKAAEIADIVGVTMYRSSWDVTDRTFGLNPYTFLAPEFYSAKAAVIETYYNKPVISIELQAEPWASTGLAEASLDEKAQSMNIDLFKENIEFAKQAGLGGYYFWGAEWWYYMKTKQNQPEIWNEARTHFLSEN